MASASQAVSLRPLAHADQIPVSLRMASAGQVIDIQRSPDPSTESAAERLLLTNSAEIVHLRVPAGQQIPTYEAQGDSVLHCLSGHVEITASRRVHKLEAGQLLFLRINEPFSLVALRDSSLLATIILPSTGQSIELIG